MRTWLAVRKAVSDANSPNAQGSSIRLGTTSGSAVAMANSAFSRATAWMMRSTTGLRKAGNWRASGSARSSWSCEDLARRWLPGRRVERDKRPPARDALLVQAPGPRFPERPDRPRGRPAQAYRRASAGMPAGSRKSSSARKPRVVCRHQADVHGPAGAAADFVRIQSETAARACFSMSSIEDQSGPLGAGKAEHHLQALPPFYRQPDSLHLDRRREEAQDGFGGGMEFERRRHQQQPRRLGAQLDAGKITVRGELAAVQMPFDADPIIQRLQRQVQIGRRLQLDHRQPAGAVHRQQIHDAALARRRRPAPGRRPARGAAWRPGSRSAARACDSSHASGLLPVERVVAVGRFGRARAVELLHQALDFGGVVRVGRAALAQAERAGRRRRSPRTPCRAPAG